MTIELPDVAAMRDLSPEDLRLELACALYARGKIGKVGGANLAGVDMAAFQTALGMRGVDLYTLEMLELETRNLAKLFPA
jgi:predicted HTH domain antitoxin